MNIFGRATGFSAPRLGKQTLVSLSLLLLLFATWPQKLSAYQDSQAPAQTTQATPLQDGANGQASPAPPYAQQTPEELQQLVAPIALYPDSLVAQILAASTFPEQVVEADRWVQAHPDLKGDALGQAVDQQPWDPSVEALTAFPSVLGNMDKNLSWTSSLGDAYYNQQQDVMDAVQVMRQRAEEAGNLKTTPQQTVATQGATIVIEPASPDVVYVPAYDPWSVYGGPIVAWPGWYPYPGIWYGGPYLSFGVGFGVGFFGGFGWGWPHWGFDWHNRSVLYNHNRYFSRSNTFYNRNNFYRGGRVRGGVNVSRGRTNAGSRPSNGHIAGRGGVYNRPGATTKPFNGNTRAARGYAEPRGQSGVRSGAFSGYNHGGQARSFSSRGRASVGGGAARGGGTRGGGGSRGGGGGSRGGRR
ncbi:MAG TPA: DUF3300 domain-containing protein [Candidatus Acidoferrales bacterium]|nr:DUF3300 domain-containing protein [Candidatus Acidoferrales bacterium]